MSPGVLRVRSKSLLKCLNCFLDQVLLKVEVPQVIGGFGELGVEFQGFFESFYRLGNVLFLRELNSPAKIFLRVAWLRNVPLLLLRQGGNFYADLLIYLLPRVPFGRGEGRGEGGYRLHLWDNR